MLTQGCIYLIDQISTSLLSKPEDQSNLEFFNYKKGVVFQKLAVLHGYLYTYECFMERIMQFRNEKCKQIVNDLCLLFGTNTLLGPRVSEVLIEGEYLSQVQIESLLLLKEDLLARLRPKLIGLVDGFGFPEHLIRSDIAKGNLYENFLNMARKSQINDKIQEAAFVVKNIKNHLNKARL